MRGNDQQLQTGMFSYVALEDRIPADHPLRMKPPTQPSAPWLWGADRKLKQQNSVLPGDSSNDPQVAPQGISTSS